MSGVVKKKKIQKKKNSNYRSKKSVVSKVNTKKKHVVSKKKIGTIIKKKGSSSVSSVPLQKKMISKKNIRSSNKSNNKNPTKKKTEELTPVDPELIKATLSVHNTIRKLHCVEDLEWDDECYQKAKKWAEHFAKNNKFEKSDSITKNGEKTMGMNMYRYTASSSEKLDQEKAPLYSENATKSWYNEARFYDYVKPTGLSAKTSHFTQIVWKATKKVGAYCAITSDGADLIVCANYYPVGNVQNMFKENVIRSRYY